MAESDQRSADQRQAQQPTTNTHSLQPLTRLMACLLERRRAPVAWVKAGLAVWLFSPFTAVISTRGSGEALVTCMLLGMLCLLDAGRPLLAGLCYGLAVHWRLYPIIYALPLLRNLAMRRGARLLSIPGIVFGAAAAAAFLTLGGLGYHLYGHSFLQETYLYHLGRVDPRHNFSPFFLPTYLASGGGAGISIGGCGALTVEWVAGSYFRVLELPTESLSRY